MHFLFINTIYTVQGGFNTVIEASIGRDVWFVLMKVGSPPSSFMLANLRPKPDNAQGMTRPSIHSTGNFVYKHVDIYFLAGGQATGSSVNGKRQLAGLVTPLPHNTTKMAMAI